MRPKGLLFLALLVLGLGAFIWFVERDLPDTEERETRAKRLVVLEADEVTTVRIEREAGPVALERPARSGDEEDGVDADRPWRLVEPLDAAADRWAVDGLVGELVGLEKERTLEGVDREEYGLEPAELVVTVGSESGSEIELEIGRQLPASSRRVAAVGGTAEIVVIDGALVSTLSQPPDAWRDKALVALDRNTVDRIRLRREDTELLLARRSDEFWIESPIVDRAESEAVDGLLGQLTSLRAEAFLEAPETGLAVWGLEPAWGRIEVVSTGDEAPVEIEIGEAMDGGLRRVRVGGQLASARTTLAEALTRSLDEWRSHDWTATQVYEVDGLEIEVDGESFALAREGTDWTRDGGVVDYSLVSDLLYSLTDVRSATLEEGPAPSSPPWVRVVFVREEKPDESLRLYRTEDGSLLAENEGRDTLLRLGAEVGRKLVEQVEIVRTAEITVPEAIEPATETTVE